MCDGSERCDLQTNAGDGELMGCGCLEVGCLAGHRFNRHLLLPLFTPSRSLFSGPVERDFGGEGENGRDIRLRKDHRQGIWEERWTEEKRKKKGLASS